MAVGVIGRSIQWIALLLFLLSAAVCYSHAQVIGADDDLLPSGQKSDGCTLIPDGHIKKCCVEHDREYFFGGSDHERRVSDRKLFFCVAEKKGFHHKLFAPFIWLGVRIGGLPFLPTKFRWGFGKPYLKKKTKPEPASETTHSP